ncbi:MAG: hypothetical protein ACT6WE_28805, partial [Shinella sp.]|uniref:hypothetical protein n=1 Tax=Shinella sp. TaxID=1870904 RepID=UPI0040366E0F
MSRSGMAKACLERPRFNSDIIPGMSPSVCRLIDKTSHPARKVRISTPNQLLNDTCLPNRREGTGPKKRRRACV